MVTMPGDVLGKRVALECAFLTVSRGGEHAHFLTRYRLWSMKGSKDEKMPRRFYDVAMSVVICKEWSTC